MMQLTDLGPLITIAALALIFVPTLRLYRRQWQMGGALIALGVAELLQVAQLVINLLTVHTPGWTLWLSSGGVLLITVGWSIVFAVQRRRFLRNIRGSAGA